MHIKIIKSKTGGFSFAITAVTAIGASIYYLSSYIKNTAIAPADYFRVIGFVLVALIFLIFLLLYIFIQGYALGLQDPKDYELKTKNERFASNMYLVAFLIFIMLFTNVFFLFFIPSNLIPFISTNPESITSKIYYLLLFFLSIVISFKLLGWPYSKNIEKYQEIEFFSHEENKQKSEKLNLILKSIFSIKTKQKLAKFYFSLKGIFSEKSRKKSAKFYFILKSIFSEKSRIKLAKFFLVGGGIQSVKIPRNIIYHYFASIFLGLSILLWFVLWIFLINSPLFSGHVIIEMGNIYNKNDTIPAYIKKTGPIYDSQLKLYKEYSKDNLTPIDNLSFKLSEINSSKKASGDNSILNGNTFELGTYYIYINTTNAKMTAGYYELRYSSFPYEYGKSFYLN